MALTVTEMASLKPESPTPRRAASSQYLTHLPERPPVDIEFTDISYSVPDVKGGLMTLKQIFESVGRDCAVFRMLAAQTSSPQVT